ncbi:MAG: ankyrin repeat domain-containing protein, partial [Thermofilaceae archaeon]
MSELHKAAEEGDLQRVKKLVENGANVNAKDEYGSTPLYLAVLNGHLELARFLVEKGANVNAKDIVGWTPLHIAA